MKNISLALIIFAAFFMGCQKESEQSLWTKVEASAASANADSTVLLCQTLLKEYPTGTHAPAAVYMIAETYYRGKRDPRTAAGYYRYFVEKYPDRVQTPVAMFLIGFIYNNDIRNPDSARIGYEQFLAKYPKHDLASSATFELNNIGKTADAILAEQNPDTIAKK